jgi:phosphate transport system permease protein
MNPALPAEPRTAPQFKRRAACFGLNLDETMRYFFTGNAALALVALALITIFLFREGAEFLPQNLQSLRIYRQAGLEYVDIIRAQTDDHTALSRFLQDVRQRQLDELLKTQSPEQANATLAGFDQFTTNFDDSITDLRGLVSDLTELATATKEKVKINDDARLEQLMLLKQNKAREAGAIKTADIDFESLIKPITGTLPAYQNLNAALRTKIEGAVSELPPLPSARLQLRLVTFRNLCRKYLDGFPEIERRLKNWDYAKPIGWHRAVTSFIFGREWITNSFWQDCFGVVPLFVGSLLISFVALALAAPFGICSAIYVSEFTHVREQRFIKPCIEFITAIPSVVLGFFGIAILGEATRRLSNVAWLRWVPGFPFSERLNVFTAGALLGLMAVPTIFSLAEDALTNVPHSYKEASYAVGATRLQTIIRILVPASLSGIISAVLLGFGRVIGETMVVLLCAGNRISIPDFSQGLGVIFQPVHTMTGIIAQEMGEVVHGSIHYRALFMIGMLLFGISLAINWAAQSLVRRYRISIG